MDLHSIFKSAGIPHTCGDCCRRCIGCNTACGKFYPANMQGFLENAVEYLRDRTEPSREKYLRRRPVKDRTSYDDKVTTLDMYYVMFINSVLAEIRKGKADYVFDFGQIKEIMRFERDISVKYIPDAGAFEIKIRKVSV